MNRQEAIETLEAMAMAESTFSDEESKKCCEAIDLAVEALKRAEKAENELFRMKTILSFPKLYEREGVIYPIKNTTKKQVYKAMLDAQKEAGIYGRCFYNLIKEE